MFKLELLSNNPNISIIIIITSLYPTYKTQRSRYRHVLMFSSSVTLRSQKRARKKDPVERFEA